MEWTIAACLWITCAILTLKLEAALDKKITRYQWLVLYLFVWPIVASFLLSTKHPVRVEYKDDKGHTSVGDNEDY